MHYFLWIRFNLILLDRVLWFSGQDLVPIFPQALKQPCYSQFVSLPCFLCGWALVNPGLISVLVQTGKLSLPLEFLSHTWDNFQAEFISYSFFLKKIYFVFWLCWVFIAICRLAYVCICMQACTLWWEGATLYCSLQWLFLYRTWALGAWASVVVARGL